MYGSMSDGSDRDDEQFELSTYSRDELFKNKEWLYENNTNVRSENNVCNRRAKGAR